MASLVIAALNPSLTRSHTSLLCTLLLLLLQSSDSSGNTTVITTPEPQSVASADVAASSGSASPCDNLKIATVLDYSKHKLAEAEVQRMVHNYFATLRALSPAAQVVAFTSAHNAEQCADVAARYDGAVECVTPRAPEPAAPTPQKPQFGDLWHRLEGAAREIGLGVKAIWMFMIDQYLDSATAAGAPTSLFLTDIDVSWHVDPLPALAAKCHAGHEVAVVHELQVFELNSGAVFLSDAPSARGLLRCMTGFVTRVVDASNRGGSVAKEFMADVMRDVWGELERHTNPRILRRHLRSTMHQLCFDQDLLRDCARNVATGETRMRYSTADLRENLLEMLTPLLPPGHTIAGPAPHDFRGLNNVYDFQNISREKDRGDDLPSVLAYANVTVESVKDPLREMVPEWMQHHPDSVSFLALTPAANRWVGPGAGSIAVYSSEGPLYMDSSGWSSAKENDQPRRSIVRHCIGKDEACLYEDP